MDKRVDSNTSIDIVDINKRSNNSGKDIDTANANRRADPSTSINKANAYAD